jgi:hypothetical protein
VRVHVRSALNPSQAQDDGIYEMGNFKLPTADWPI